MLDINVLKEDHYKYYLVQFLGSNPGKSERNFLNQEIDKCAKYLNKKKTPITDSEFEEILKKDHPNPKNLPNYESWIKSKAKHYTKLGKLRGNEVKRIKMDLEIRLSRLPVLAKATPEKAWFTVGILFATGEMQNLLREHGNARKISRLLYNENSKKYRPYISSSSAQSHEHGGKDKNIYSSYSKMSEIILHCQRNNLDVTEEFITKSKLIKPL